LSFDDLADVFSESKHKAGIHQIIDPEAVKIMKREHMKLFIVNGFKPDNILAAVNGEVVGTVVN
jgi:uridylate kinase